MHDAEGWPVLRWPDLLCGAHAAQAATGVWPFETRELQDIRTSCLPCMEQMMSHLEPIDNEYVVQAHALPSKDDASLRAIIAAATAISSLAGGASLEYVDIDPVMETGSASTWWSSSQLGSESYLAVKWAGGIAGLRWLAEQGMGSPENRIGVAATACSDQAEARRTAIEHGLPGEAGRALAATLVDERWSDITAVAEHLVTVTVATEEQITALLAQQNQE